MDWRVCALYVDFKYSYNISQSWWQRLKGRLTNRYEITISTPGVKNSFRTYVLTSDYQREFNLEFMKIKESLVQRFIDYIMLLDQKG